MAKNTSTAASSPNPNPNASSSLLFSYIHQLSGQAVKINIVEKEHSYSKIWSKHPDPIIKSRPAKFLFMNHFPKHFLRSFDYDEDEIDVETVTIDEQFTTPNPFTLEANNLSGKPTFFFNDENIGIESIPNKSNWSLTLQRLWSKALNILYSDRLSKLTIDESPNELIQKKILSHRCANKFRHLFASTALWDANLLSCLHSALCEYLSGYYLSSYHEAMQMLRQKIPTLIDKFYTSPKNEMGINVKGKMLLPDPIQTILSNHKPKRIVGSPLFLIVPSHPQMPHALISQRMKHWHNIFGSLGKIVTPTVVFKPSMAVAECLSEIRLAIKEKINECKTTFNEGRPLILVGFGHSSLIAAHCALDNASHVTATICLGFPLTGINGFRGDLDDPLLETTVPTLFVIGQNSTMSTIDDMEDFRERITKTETGLVVIGGANDRLIVSGTKQRFAGVTQSVVDRCIADEIYDFVNTVLNPHYISSENSGPEKKQSNNASTSNSTSHSKSSSHSSSKNVPRTMSLVDGASAKSKPLKRKRIKKCEIASAGEEVKSKTEEKFSNINSSINLQTQTDSGVESTPPTPSKKRADSTVSANVDTFQKPPFVDEPIKGKEKQIEPTETLPSVPETDSVEPLTTKPTTPQLSQAITNAQSEPAINSVNFERHYGFSYDISEVPTLVSSGNTRTRTIRAPKQLDM